jgi:Xaa-Pro aminopeptidase
MGQETHLRMPLADFDAIRAVFPNTEFVDATPLIRELRLIKSEAEIEKIAHVCGIVSSAFESLPQLISLGDTEMEVFRKFKIDILQRGADDVPYLVGGAGSGGYDDIISPPSDRAIQDGDILMLDTGSVFDGYFCDFDRNYAFGHASDTTKKAYEVLYQATEAGLQAAHPGATCRDIFHNMLKILETNGASTGNVGRLGHGLGMQLTEWPSHTYFDDTVLAPGMVLTLEPGLSIAAGKMMVHEENIVIRENGPELLTRRAPRDLPIL